MINTTRHENNYMKKKIKKFVALPHAVSVLECCFYKTIPEKLLGTQYF